MIVGVGHVARAGKDSFAAALVERHGFTRIAFADALKQIAYESNPSTRSIVDQYGWEAAKTSHPGVRRYLVDLGNACRKRLGEDVWIQALARQLEPGVDYVIPDVRYPNELAWLQQIIDLGTWPFQVRGIAVKVNRPGVEALPNVADQALADCDDWDVIVENDGTLDDLGDKATDIRCEFAHA
jgi:hypothetical protein